MASCSSHPEEIADADVSQIPAEFDDYTAVALTQTPTAPPWKLPVMYRFSATGLTYIWMVAFDGTELRRVHGTEAAPKVISLAVETNTSGRDLNQQAFLQACRLFKDKYLEGYQQAGATSTPNVVGMKGYPYQEGKVKRWPVLVSPKLDGVRVLAQHQGGSVVSLRSYKNRSFDHLKLIQDQVRAFMPYLPAYATLDGEAYVHGMPLPDIRSIVKTEIGTHPDTDQIIYYIFDIVYEDNPPSEVRYRLLKQAFQAYQRDVGQVPNLRILGKWLVDSHATLMDHFEVALKQGYEGLVLNYCGGSAKPESVAYKMAQYKFGRSNRIFKLKAHQDEEGTVIRVEAAKGKERDKGILVLRDQYGFDVPIRMGSEAERRTWLREPASIVGKEVTFRHRGRDAKSNRAQQPTGVCIRDYE